MAIYEVIKAFFLGIIQGITEWLPISSTGHMILFENIFKFNMSQQFINTFFVVIQLGSIMAVIVLYFKKLNPFKKEVKPRNETISLWFKIAVAAVPAAIIGLLFDDKIDSLLYNPLTVAITLIVYGILFLIIESKPRKVVTDDLTKITFKTALIIGTFQVLALIPGTSRSGATILGAMFLGTSRFVASEFSFFLAIPMMLGASALKLIKIGFVFSSLELVVLLVGMITAFVVSIFAIKLLIGYIKKHNFNVFGYYRIILGSIILIIYLLGVL